MLFCCHIFKKGTYIVEISNKGENEIQFEIVVDYKEIQTIIHSYSYFSYLSFNQSKDYEIIADEKGKFIVILFAILIDYL